MSRLAACFANLRRERRAALVCYITAGDPSLTVTEEAVAVMLRSGADIIEIGVPFSDPVADGPTIQQSSQRALRSGTTLAGVLECVRRIRSRTEAPLVAMTYYNPVLRYGCERFARDAREAGLDATLLTDLPPEEARQWLATSADTGLDTVFLVAPTSTAHRLEAAARMSSGFLYCVSRLGVTGTRADLPEELSDLVSSAKRAAGCPVCVGFGISTPEQVRKVSLMADGVVIGSALVSVLGDGGPVPSRLRRLGELTAALAAATRP